MDSASQQGGVYQLHSNGHSEGVSPNSSQLSMEGRDSTLVTRTQKQHVSHNVTTTTKTIREVQYIGPDGQPIDYIPAENGGQFAYENHNHISDYQNHQFGDYQMYGGDYGDHSHHWVVQDTNGAVLDGHGGGGGGGGPHQPPQGGDSWV